MIRKILIANRGEIAVRIIRTAREMGIKTVAVYSTADKEALHVKLADESVCIGGAAPIDSYLNIKNIISAAVLTHADAIHPGFGFLAENSSFAEVCDAVNIKFIGPSSSVIEKMGNKSSARELMIESEVPVVPGSAGTYDANVAYEEACKMGFPVLIKASAGGGGRGMRRVFKKEDFIFEFHEAQREAELFFSNGEIYVEKLILNPHHIEFQILADSFGNTIHLGERDCSIQRRNQKMIEETPSPILSDEKRAIMGEHAVKAAKAANYENAGTIEFIVDEEGNHYFIEMNTRIQVEHPITEMRYQIDLIKEQILIASGQKLSFTESDLTPLCHSIECRINAENPAQNFRPSPGTVRSLFIPGGFGTRVDTFLYQGCKIAPNYDSMIAKVISFGKTRQEAIHRMRRILEELIIDGVDTNIELLYNIFLDEDFVAGHFNTSFIDTKLKDLLN